MPVRYADVQPAATNAANDTRLVGFAALAQPPSDLHDDNIKAYAEAFVATRDALVTLHAKADTVRAAKTLTPEGVAIETNTLVAKQTAELEKIYIGPTGILTRIDAELNERRVKALQTPASKDDPTLRYLRAKDAIEYFSSLDPAFYKQTFDEAVAAGDTDFFDALTRAPRWTRAAFTKKNPRFDDLLNAAQEQLAATRDPSIARLAAQRAAYSRIFEHALTVVREVGAGYDARTPPQRTGNTR